MRHIASQAPRASDDGTASETYVQQNNALIGAEQWLTQERTWSSIWCPPHRIYRLVRRDYSHLHTICEADDSERRSGQRIAKRNTRTHPSKTKTNQRGFVVRTIHTRAHTLTAHNTCSHINAPATSCRRGEHAPAEASTSGISSCDFFTTSAGFAASKLSPEPQFKIHLRERATQRAHH